MGSINDELPYTMPDTGGNIDARDPADPSRPAPSFDREITRDDPMSQLYGTTHKLSTGWRRDVTGPTSETVNTAALNVQLAAQKAAEAIREGDQAAFKALRNLDLHPDGRRARSQQAIADARAKADEHIASAEADLKVLTVFLEQDAMPKMQRGEEQTARMDVQLALSGDGNLDTKMMMLASDPGSIGALVTNPDYMRLLFMSKGIDKTIGETLITVARQSAIQAAEKSGNPARRTAAVLLRRATRNLQGSISSAKQMRQNVKAR